MSLAGIAWVVLTGVVALGFSSRVAFRRFAFPAWVGFFVSLAMVWPVLFDRWGGVDLKVLIVPLIQVITFGMGTTLSSADFARVLRVPWPVFVGFFLQFTIMPLVGYAIAAGMGFENEIAAGIILVGSVSGGVASNLVTYLAGGDVALSVTMTACSTLASPVATPVLMKLLAGRKVPIHMGAMMLDILNMILVPIVAGLVAHRILYGRDRRLNEPWVVAGIGFVGMAVALTIAVFPVSVPQLGALRPGLILGFGLLGLVGLGQLVMSVWLARKDDWMEAVLTWVSMAGICLIIAIITARSRANLITVGPLLLVAAALHNSLGYFFGYWGARLAKLDERTSRTVAIEVGMQNSGMASALAMNVLASTKAALAPAIFGPWMNLSGALLATWWKRRPTDPEKSIARPPSPTSPSVPPSVRPD